jgi:hypothetical protein
MTNLLQEIEMKSPRTNSTFGFCRHTKKTDPKKPKELFFATASLLTIDQRETKL